MLYEVITTPSGRAPACPGAGGRARLSPADGGRTGRGAAGAIRCGDLHGNAGACAGSCIRGAGLRATGPPGRPVVLLHHQPSYNFV